MSRFGGDSTVVIAAPLHVCFAIVCDTPRTPEWHEAVAAVEVLELDGEGRTAVVRTKLDITLARLEVNLRVSYEDGHPMHMYRDGGDLKALTATWTFLDTAEGETEATFETEFDPGWALSALAKGPVVGRLEALLAHQPTVGLKRAAEAAQRH